MSRRARRYRRDRSLPGTGNPHWTPLAACRRGLRTNRGLLVVLLFLHVQAGAQTDTSTRTPTVTPTRNPTHLACAGNCDGGPEVTVDELIRGVNIALGNLSLGQCPSFDVNGSGYVTIEELVKAVANALYGCGFVPPSPLPTWTRTATVTGTTTPSATGTATPTATLTPTATASRTNTRLPSGTPTQTRTLTSTPTRTPTMTPTPLGIESVCGGFVSAVPKLCNVEVWPTPIRLGGTYAVRYCLSDLDGDVNQFCLGIQTSPEPPILNCRPFTPPGTMVNTCSESSPILFTNPVGSYVAHVQFRDRTGHRSGVETVPFQVVP